MLRLLLSEILCSRSGSFRSMGGYSWLDLPVRDYPLFINREQVKISEQLTGLRVYV